MLPLPITTAVTGLAPVRLLTFVPESDSPGSLSLSLYLQHVVGIHIAGGVERSLNLTTGHTKKLKRFWPGQWRGSLRSTENESQTS